MSTDIDGSLPSVTLDPVSDERPDPKSTWLQEEMRRRMATATGSGGRHARGGPADLAGSSADYVPRHAGSPPGPPEPVPRPRPPRSDTSLPGIRPVTADDPRSRPAPVTPDGSDGSPAPGSVDLSSPRPGPARSPQGSHDSLGGPGSPSLSGPMVRRRRPEPPSAAAAARLLNSPTAAPEVALPVVNLLRPAPAPAGDPVVAAQSAPLGPAATIDVQAVALPPAPPAAVGAASPAVIPPADLGRDPHDRDLDGDLDAGDLEDDDLEDGDLEDGDLDDGDLDDGDLDDFDVAEFGSDLPLGPGGERILWSATPPPPARFPAAPFPSPGPGRAGTVVVAERRAAAVVAAPAAPDAAAAGHAAHGADAANGAATVGLVDQPAGEGRTRVVLSERKGIARPVRNVVELQEGGTVGDLLRRNLIGSQLTVALRFAVGGGLVLLLLPALFWMSPAIGLVSILGFRLPWLLLGVGVYPFLLGLGLWFTRTAERAEKNFADQVQDS